MKLAFKFISLFILPFITYFLVYSYFQSIKPEVFTIKDTGEKVLSIPYQSTLYEDFGTIYTPNATFAVKTPTGFKNLSFLIDTGAIVSAIPAKEAESLGVNLAYLPRVAVEGYGGQTTFTYRGDFTLKLLDDLVTVPCIYSQVDNYNYILGRKGIFDAYTLTFDTQKKAVEFIKKI